MNVRLLLNSQAHFNHTVGAAQILRATAPPHAAARRPFLRSCFPARSPSLHHHQLPGIAPGAHHAFEPDGADSDPHFGPRNEAAQRGFAAAEEAGQFPIAFSVGVAGVGLHFVDAAVPVGAVAQDEAAADVALAHDEIRGCPRWGVIGAAPGLVT